MTSLRFMLVDVPEPVWNTSSGKASACAPSATSSAAREIAAARSPESTSRSPFTVAAHDFSSASARMSRGSRVVPEIGKFSTARWVCAPHRASAGTSMSPRESCSVRVSTTPKLARHPSGDQPVVLVAVLQSHRVGKGVDLVEHLAEGLLKLGRLVHRPDDQGAAGPQ